MAILRLETMRIDDVKEYADNPRKNKKALKPVKESIKKFGYTNPIIINKENVILAGHTRLQALKEIGEEYADVIRLDRLTEDQERAFRIVDNRTHEFSKWDKDLLESEIREIKSDDWEKFGFDKIQIERMTAPDMCTCPKCGKQFLKVKC